MLIDLLHQYLLLILFLTGFLAGTVDAIAGGGGLISLPILLGMGIPPHLALGTNKLQGLFGTAMATYSYYRQGWLSKQGLLEGLFFSFIGAIFGAVASQFISSDILKKMMPLLLLLVLIYTIFSPKLGTVDTKPKMNEKWFYIIFGILLGFYDGFFGPGTGSFWVFSLVFFLGQSLLKATAYTKALNFNTNIAAVICFAIGNNIDYKLALIMAVGQLIGGRLGAQLAIKKGVKLIRPVFLLVVSATITVLVYRSYTTLDTFMEFTQKYNIAILSILVIFSVIAIYIWNEIKRRKSLVKDDLN